MIIKMDETWREKVMMYLSDEPALNLFIISDIENFGFDNDFQEIWSDVDDNGEIQGLLLRYYGNYLPYGKGIINAEQFSEIINQDKTYEMISGKKEIVDQFLPYVKFQKTKETYFAELKNTDKLSANLKKELIQQAGVQDVDRLIELMSQVFSAGPTSRQSLEKALQTKTGRTYFIQEGDKVVSMASTTAENSLAAMIVGVCSHPDRRNQGLASLCMDALCQDVLAEGKSICLFYDNPKAGSIYKRLGFQDIDKWSMNYPSHERAAAPETTEV
jgi:uncharacterized protein